MNNEILNKRLTPQMALIIYSDKKEYSSSYFIEKRDIKAIDGKFTFLAPTPLSESTLKKLADFYKSETKKEIKHQGLIPSHLLFGQTNGGVSYTMWYRPAMKRSLNFSSQLKIKGNSSECFIPATLYLVVDRSLYIFALSSNDRPTESTKLFKAPFFNIYSDGRVCLGTAPIGKQKKSSYVKEAENFERAFYMAEQNGGEHINQTKTPLRELWSKLITAKSNFPKSELVPHEKFKTLGSLIQKLISLGDE